MFAACTESLLPQSARQRIVAASERDTVYTRAFDIAASYPWPARYGERVLANEFSNRWTGREHELADDLAARTALARATELDDHEILPINAGQGVGQIHAIRPAAEIIRQLSSDAAALLTTWQAL